MEVERFAEELEQIQREMLSYVRFYKNGVLVFLRMQLQELEDALKGDKKSAILLESFFIIPTHPSQPPKDICKTKQSAEK